MQRHTLLLLSLFVLTQTACNLRDKRFLPNETLFGYGQDRGILENKHIKEASGLANSRLDPNLFWTHNDHGDKNRIFCVDQHGADKATFFLKNTVNRDWEDIAIAKIDSISYLYIGDIGDNDAAYDIKNIYRVKEPVVRESDHGRIDTLDGVELIRVQYPDAKRNAETLMIDPLTQDLYIVSKFEKNVLVYRVPYPQSFSTVNTAELIGTIPLTMVTAGDISPDGKEILIKNYGYIIYWKRQPGQSIADALKGTFAGLPYYSEPHGEAIAFASDGTGYWTVSEIKHEIPAHMYFYPRK